MGERYYSLGGDHGADISFSPQDDDFGCLCMFPHNDIAMGEWLGEDRVACLALLGAAVVLAQYNPEMLNDTPFLPHALPQWIRDGILKVTGTRPAKYATWEGKIA